jgi:hypothetical protein
MLCGSVIVKSGQEFLVVFESFFVQLFQSGTELLNMKRLILLHSVGKTCTICKLTRKRNSKKASAKWIARKKKITCFADQVELSGERGNCTAEGL